MLKKGRSEDVRHDDLQKLNAGDYVHLTAAEYASLSGSGDSTDHYHASDRARANHTGTQTAATISDFAATAQAEVTFEVLDANGDVGTGAAQVAAGDHAHAGTYIGAAGVTYENLSANSDIGTGATQVAQGDHDHSGTYIGAAGVTYENLDANGDVGTGATQVSQGDHAHAGTYIGASGVTYENLDANGDVGTSAGQLAIGNHTHGGGAGGGWDLQTSDINVYIDPTSGNDSTGDGSQGSPWQTWSGGFEPYMEDKMMQEGTYAYVFYSAGHHTVADTIAPAKHPSGTQIVISGETTYDRNVTSIQSTSGSHPARAWILNVDSVANLAANDWALFHADAANGTYPQFLCGMHKITNVDAVNTRITIEVAHQRGAPSGAVTCSFQVFKTSLTFANKDGITLSDGVHIGIGAIAIASSTSTDDGVFLDHSSRLRSHSPWGISSFDYGMRAFGSEIYFEGSAISKCASQGALLYAGTVARVYNAVLSGHTNANWHSSYGSSTYGEYAVTTGGDYGWFTDGGRIYAPNSYPCGNHLYGSYAQRNGYIDTNPSTYYFNVTNSGAGTGGQIRQ